MSCFRRKVAKEVEGLASTTRNFWREQHTCPHCGHVFISLADLRDHEPFCDLKPGG